MASMLGVQSNQEATATHPHIQMSVTALTHTSACVVISNAPEANMKLLMLCSAGGPL